MKTIATKISMSDELNVVERTARTVVGSVLIGSVFVPNDGTLGWLALLPLLGIYLLHSGVSGIALRSLFTPTTGVYRITYAAASIAFIGSVFVIGAAPLGALVALPLLGIYTGLGAVLGRSPLATAIEANKLLPNVIWPTGDGVSSDVTEAAQTTLQHAA